MLEYRIIFILVIVFSTCNPCQGEVFLTDNIIDEAIQLLKQNHPEEHFTRIEKGVNQVARFWYTKDGSEEEFKDFCEDNFISDPVTLDETFNRFEKNFETIYGMYSEVNRAISSPIQLENGPILPVDYLFAQYSPFTHLSEDFFTSRIAFTILLNFVLYTTDEMLEQGTLWSRKKWAEAKLAKQFSKRIPSEINQQLTEAYFEANNYISKYNIYMHNLVDGKGFHLFPEGLRLVTHWGLRDELKGQYSDRDGYHRQKLIETVMERIIKQEIPENIIDSTEFDWDPVRNRIYKNGKKTSFKEERNKRYRMMHDIFRAEKSADKHNSVYPTKIDRRFLEGRMIPVENFEKYIVTLLTHPVAKQIAELISKRLNRKLEPFDIWYNGFKERAKYTEAELDKIVLDKYPTVKRFQDDLKNILTRLGFNKSMAVFLSDNIVVDPSRGIGHARGSSRRGDKAHLRTRFTEQGLNYKGYNIAVHEFGHNVEQVLSLNKIDYYSLRGVPNTAFTEAFAFVFQARDMELLGLAEQDPMNEYKYALSTYWATCEIGAVGLVDMKVWQWMYEHPDADPDDLKKAVIKIAKNIWNKYYAPLIGEKNSILLAVYSHMIESGLYLPDYSIGQIIKFQIEDFLKGKNLGDEIVRMCTIGSISPDAWSNTAVGSEISVEPLINAAQTAVKKLQ